MPAIFLERGAVMLDRSTTGPLWSCARKGALSLPDHGEEVVDRRSWLSAQRSNAKS